jgi:hypothetical protein
MVCGGREHLSQFVNIRIGIPQIKATFNDKIARQDPCMAEIEMLKSWREP